VSQPKVILLDAVGTLFGVRRSVGQIYGEIASQFGVSVDAHSLNKAFFQSFREAPPMAFPEMDTNNVQQHEYNWWKTIATQTFERVGVYSQFSNFAEFFDFLYAYFATPEAWLIYDDVPEALNYWREHQIELGVLSNFDSRIHRVLPALGLSRYFNSVTISTEVGAAKPDPAIFWAALNKHKCPPTAVWHIGDSYQEDYQAARAIGIRGIWIRRRNDS
jgi:putative hydrolase of the HAD superfamily